MRVIIRRALVLYAALTTYPLMPVFAALKTNNPLQVCEFLADLGFRTSGWKNQYEGVFGCLSPYKELGGNPLANNLAFYVDGNKTTVTQIKLVLNINDRADAKSAHSELLNTAEILSVKATGQQLPQPLKGAIQGGRKASAKVGTSSVDVIRRDWPTGKGYEIQVTIK